MDTGRVEDMWWERRGEERRGEELWNFECGLI